MPLRVSVSCMCDVWRLWRWRREVMVHSTGKTKLLGAGMRALARQIYH